MTVLILLSGGVILWSSPKVLTRWQQSQAVNDVTVIVPPSTALPASSLESDASSPLRDDPATSFPDRVNLDVPFTSQAPYAVWDEHAKEACEEASVTMAQWYAQGRKGSQTTQYNNLIPPDYMDGQTHDLIDWQQNTFGYYEDTNTEETLRMLTEKLGVKNARTITDVSEESFKRELIRGNILVVPVAGQLLKNPFFQGDGPAYHKIVVRGYNEKGFITNEPGISKGEGYVYSAEMLINAVHDWTGDDSTIQNGKKVAIVIGLE